MAHHKPDTCLPRLGGGELPGEPRALIRPHVRSAGVEDGHEQPVPAEGEGVPEGEVGPVHVVQSRRVPPPVFGGQPPVPCERGIVVSQGEGEGNARPTERRTHVSLEGRPHRPYPRVGQRNLLPGDQVPRREHEVRLPLAHDAGDTAGQGRRVGRAAVRTVEVAEDDEPEWGRPSRRGGDKQGARRRGRTRRIPLTSSRNLERTGSFP